MAVLAAILARASELAAAFLCQHSDSDVADQGAQAHVGRAVFRPTKNLQYGDVFASKAIGTVVAQKVQTEAGSKIEDFLKYQETPYEESEIYFQKVTLNPQGQLCLSLHWPVVFAKGIGEVIDLGVKYGFTTDKVMEPVFVAVPQSDLRPLPRSACKGATLDASGLDCPSGTLASLSVAEGRVLLLAGLLLRLLKTAGHSVQHLTTFDSYQEALSPDSPLYPVWHLLNTLSTEPPPDCSSAATASVEQFLSSLSALPQYLISPDGECRDRAQLAETAAALSGQEAVVDAKKFLKSTGLSGRGGYDRNIHRVQITDKRGTMTPVGALAFEVYRIANSQTEGRAIIHIAQQQKSFAVQQAMVVTDILSKEKAVPWTCEQHLLVVSGVECSVDGNAVKTCTLVELIRVRLSQMTKAYVIKYREKAKGLHLQQIALKMAEAVVKFELLSANPKATVKINLPNMETEADIRFDGAFVLYNYARLATLFINFSKACERGVYPPLPDVKDIDFSLLSDKEEWQLLFHYVLQYPLLIREAAGLKRTGIGIHLEVGLKQVCLFLTKLSHAFSSYYSRVKVLMTPEPHLFPLIHARLCLMAAVKQVMYNALAVLAIEPLEQL